MNQNQHQIVAIDLAKDSLQVLSENATLSLSNNEEGFAKLKDHLRALKMPLIVIEATGGYERNLREFLHREGIALSVVNPCRIRAFAMSEGIKAKTDIIDTKMIMRFAQSKSLRITPAPDSKRQQLADLIDRRNQLSETLAREKNRLQKAPASIRPYIEEMIAIIKAQIAEIDGVADINCASAYTWPPLLQCAVTMLSALMSRASRNEESLAIALWSQACEN